jgi:hypothetical protein
MRAAYASISEAIRVQRRALLDGRQGWLRRPLGIEHRMLCNIIDHRTRPYRWRKVNAIIEATAHDNDVADSDQAQSAREDVIYDQREAISLEAAVAWAAQQAGPVTLFLYDEGAGTPPTAV